MNTNDENIEQLRTALATESMSRMMSDTLLAQRIDSLNPLWQGKPAQELSALEAKMPMLDTRLPVGVKRLIPDAVLPEYSHDGDGCFDLRAVQVEGPVELSHDGLRQATFRTGLCFEIPLGYVMLCFSRSGQGFKHDVRLANCVGVVDATYKGEVTVKLRLDDEADGKFTVREGDRIVQCMVIPRPEVRFFEVDELSASDRGTNGYGSTGVQ